MTKWKKTIEEGIALRKLIDGEETPENQTNILDMVYKIINQFHDEKFEEKYPYLYELSWNWDGFTGELDFEYYESGELAEYYDSFTDYVNSKLTDLYDACDYDEVFLAL